MDGGFYTTLLYSLITWIISVAGMWRLQHISKNARMLSSVVFISNNRYKCSKKKNKPTTKVLVLQGHAHFISLQFIFQSAMKAQTFLRNMTHDSLIGIRFRGEADVVNAPLPTQSIITSTHTSPPRPPLWRKQDNKEIS